MSPHEWRLADLAPPKPDAPTVFSCFHCGGGSTMGYKLAGLRVLGGVEIDPRMMALYRANHKPQNSYLMGVGDFNKIPDAEIPAELFNLDILDGSPPCSSFSTAGARDQKWGTATKFREGQAVQVLDDLFFDFIATARKLRPKVVVAENVKGLIIGKARGYVKQIFQGFREAGYTCQLFLLNAAAMGVPQRRERTFFVARRTDLGWPAIRLEFGGAEVPCSEAMAGAKTDGRPLTAETAPMWSRLRVGGSLDEVHPKKMRFGVVKLDPARAASTLMASGSIPMHWDVPRLISGHEAVRLQTFPEDYDFGREKPHYVCGMSVPPRMMQAVATEILRQWLRPAEVPQ